MSQEEAPSSSSSAPAPASQKRRDYLGWDDFYVALCHNATTQCPPGGNRNAAAVLDENKVLLSLVHQANDEKHTEIRALEAALARKGAFKTLSLYTTRVPCADCARAILECKVLEVVYVGQDGVNEEPLRLLEEGGVVVRKYQAQRQSVRIDFGLMVS